MPNTAPEGRGESQYLHVVAAVIAHRGSILIARRPDGLHQGGLWEFPGGKVEKGESAREALSRELEEEVGIAVRHARRLIGVRHQYPDRDVFLDVWWVDDFAGRPHGREGQPLRWVAPSDLNDYEFPAANGPIVRAVQLPPRCLITPEPGGRNEWRHFLDRLETVLSRGGIELVQFRAKSLSRPDYEELAARVVKVARAVPANVVLNSDPALVTGINGAAGVHLTSQRLRRADRRPLGENYLLGASCHGAADLRKAEAIGCDYAVLSPVCPTASHPGAKPMGWSAFEALVNDTATPSYALGGLSAADLATAWQHGGQGIAAIRSLWEARR